MTCPPLDLAATQLPARIQRVIPIDSPLFIPGARLQKGYDWPAAFGRQAPLALEIGCGTGHFILARAHQQPEIDFLAIDIYNKGCLKTCRKLEAAGVANVRVVRIEARELLIKALPAAGLQAIYINCPDPWPKLRHRERRLVNRAFLELALHSLTPTGELFFSSDCRDYVEQVAALQADLPAYCNRVHAPFVDALPGYPLSKYMRRFLERGLPVHFVHWQRDPTVPLPPRPAPELCRGFRAKRPVNHHE